MASTLSYFKYFGSSTTISRHWSLIIILTSLLNVANQLGPVTLLAQSTLALYEPEPNTILPLSVSVLNSTKMIEISGLTPTGAQLVTVPLPAMPHVPDYTGVLHIVSPNDSTHQDFVFHVKQSSKPTAKKPTLGEVCLFGFLAVTVTNFCAITGLICIPIQHFKYYSVLLTFLMALGVGALVTASVMVLIPEAMRMVDMPLEFGGLGRTYLFKMGSVLGGVLVFYVLEYCITILPRLLKCNAIHGNNEVDELGDKPHHGHSHVLQIESDVFEEDKDESSTSKLSTMNDDEPTLVKPRRRFCCFALSRKKAASIAPVAWMILLGDACHNFMDGLTIGVGFSEQASIGITLSLSILFEELPHELGDFAILVSSGFSLKTAVCLNFLSACSSYIGLIIGIGIGKIPSGAYFVFAITAGFFLYISLSDMLPELRQVINEAERVKRSSEKLFLIHIAGFLTGFLCVLGVVFAGDYITI